jgi:hypothetical protein
MRTTSAGLLLLFLSACPSSDPCEDQPNTPTCVAERCARNPADPACQPQPGPQAPKSSRAVARVDRPLCAAADDSGGNVYFVAYDAEGQVQLYTVPAAGGTPRVIPTAGLLSHPVGLAIKPDNSALYIADLGDPGGEGEETGAVLRVPLSGGTAGRVAAADLIAPAGIAMTADGKELLVTGKGRDGAPAVWRLADGGGATLLYQGAALQSPSGIAQTDDGTIYVADAMALSPREGAVVRISAGAAAVHSKVPLRLGFPAGLAPSGPRRPDVLLAGVSDKTGMGVIYLVTAGGDVSEVSLPLAATDLGPLHRSARGTTWVAVDTMSLMSAPAAAEAPGQIFVLN